MSSRTGAHDRARSFPSAADDDCELDDRSLLEALGVGDADAFWHLWLRHRGHLYSVCLRRMNGISCEAADAMSRSMLVACSKLPRYATGIVNIQAWLTRLVLNVCSDIQREQHRMVGVGTVDDLVQLEQETRQDAPPSPEDITVTHETYDSIVHAIAALPPRLRGVARLHFLAEASYERIAEELSITQENVRKRVQHARALLRRGEFTAAPRRSSIR